jgi:hypothetical protein
MTCPWAVSGRIVSSQFVALPGVEWTSRCVGASGRVASAVRKRTLLPQTSTVWLRIPAQRGDLSPQSLHSISQVSRRAATLGGAKPLSPRWPLRFS